MYEDELPAGTHVMSGRWLDTMKTPTMWRSKYTARSYEEPHSDERCFATTTTTQSIRMLLAKCLDKRDQGTEASVADYTQAFLNAENRESEQLYAQPPECWNPKFWRMADVWFGECVRPCWVSRHLRDASKNICLAWLCSRRARSVSVCQRWTGQWHWCACGRHAGGRSQWIDKEFVARTPKRHDNALGHGDWQTSRVPWSFFVPDTAKRHVLSLVWLCDKIVQRLDWRTQGIQHTQFRETWQKWHYPERIWTTLSQTIAWSFTLVGSSWHQECSLSIAHSRRHNYHSWEYNIKRLLRYLIGNPACNMIVGCNLDVPEIAGIPQSSVVVMTVATILELQFGSKILLRTRGPVCALSKKQNMVCLNTGESEMMALVGGACERIATRDQWNKICKCSPGTIVLCTDSSTALGFVKRRNASRRTRHVDKKIYFMQAFAMEPGQRILKIHGDNQRILKDTIDHNTWCVFVSSDFLSSFLKIDLSLSINQLHNLNCKLLQLDSVELILLGRNVTSITRNWAFNNVEIWVANIDDWALICFAHLSVAAPTVLRVDIAAGEEIRDVMLVMSPDMSTNFSFELHPSLGENLCSWSCCRTRSPCDVSNDSVPEIGAVAWTTPKLSTVKRMLRSRITLESERMLRLSARNKRSKRDILHTSSTSSKICMWMHNLIQIQSSWTHSTLNTVNNIATNANVCRKSTSHARNGIRYHVSHAIRKTEHRMLCKDNKCKNFKYPMP